MPVPDVDRYRPDDRRAVEALYRRVFGNDAAEASRLRWEWQYRNNPNNPGGDPEIWVAREGPAIIGQYATMPVRVAVKGREVTGSWGMDVMVAPERQRRGLGEVLFRTWDRNVGASLGLGLSEASYRLFQKLKWPDVGPVPCLIKPLSRRAFRQPQWPVALNRFISFLTWPFVMVISRSRPLSAEVRIVPRFDDSFTVLWERLAPKFDLAVRRDAAYLNWKFANAPQNNPAYKWAGGGLLATPLDLARFGAAHLAPGKLSKTALDTLFTVYTERNERSPPLGLGWRIDEDSAKRLRWHHAGGQDGARASLVVYPKEKLSIAFATNVTQAPGDVNGPSARIADAFLAA